jgi:hypothetical protein
MSAELLPTTVVDAFRATTYRVRLSDGAEFELRIDQDVDWPASDSNRTIGRWMILTADNPGARVRDDDANRTARAELDAALAESGVPVRGETRHIDPAGEWPVERGRLIEVRRFEQGLVLARRFGQAAVVCGEGPGPAELITLCIDGDPAA